MPKINLDYYKEQDNYCYYVLNKLDNDIIELLKNSENDEAVREKNPQLYYYLLNESNKGLFEWLGVNGNILDITGGLGLHTETLCKKSDSVTTVCFSKVNAEIILSRLSDYDNLEIVVGNLKDIKFDRKFDYIILSDTFEFSRVLAKNEVLFLEYLKGLLAENGRIIIAVSNKYGSGNYSGCVSHITGQAFDEINDYPKIPFLNGYTKRRLINILRNVFENVDFYYPLPNHYENKIILSDKSLNKAVIGDKVPTLFKHYGMNPNRLINEFNLIKDAIYDNRFTSVVNSYLIIAGAGVNVGVNDISDFPNYIQFDNGIMTTLTDNSCIKTPMNEEGQKTLDKMCEFYQSETERLNKKGVKNIKYAQIEKQGNSYVMEFAKGKAVNLTGLEILYDYNKFLAFGLEYKSLINKIYPDVKYQNFEFENVVLEDVACVENANIDLNMSNIFKDSDNYTITDYDKTAPIIPLNYILAQGIFVFAIDTGFAFNEVEYLKQLGLSEREIRFYQVMYVKGNG